MRRELSDKLVYTGPGTEGGELLRRYWQPVALARELKPGIPLALKIMNEDLVLFRNDQGKLGLLSSNCCHRGMDLGFGRVEDGGLRCIYHGWLFAPDGQCLEQPGEPEGSDLYKSIRQPGYPCREVANVVFAYMGPGKPPQLPPLEIFSAAEGHRVEVKLLQECNYLQASEGNLDPAHQSFLHGFRGGREASAKYRIPNAVGGTKLSNTALYAENTRPQIDLENTDFGLRAFISRHIPGEGTFLKVYNFVMPNYAIVPGGAGADGYAINWHVPIDDVSHWKFNIIFNRVNPLNIEAMRQVIFAETESEFVPKRNKRNRYLQDRTDGWYSGLGPCFVDHDTCATEMQGPIQDRSKENLGQTDMMLVRARKLMMDALGDIRKDRDPLGLIRDDASNWVPDLRVVSEFFPEGTDWRAEWLKVAEKRLVEVD